MRSRPILCGIAFLILSAGEPQCGLPPDPLHTVYPLRLFAHALRASTGAAHGSQLHLSWSAQVWHQCNIAIRGDHESDPKPLQDTYHNGFMGDKFETKHSNNWTTLSFNHKLSQTANNNRGADAFYTFLLTRNGVADYFVGGATQGLGINRMVIVAQDQPAPHHLVLAHEVGHALNLDDITGGGIENLMTKSWAPNQGYKLTWANQDGVIIPNSECETARQHGNLARYVEW